MELMEHQKDAVNLLGSGKILYGDIGVGKTPVAAAYYIKEQQPKDIYVITTAKKRDSRDWEGAFARYGISTERHNSVAGKLTVDSWNNIHKYRVVEKAFFIFDEQRVVGSGVWVRSFIKIAQRNDWILLSATPGDKWLDYGPAFVANGWYDNLTAFKREHVMFVPFLKFPKVLGYIGERKLERLRNEILVEMPYTKHTNPIHNYLDVGYDEEKYKDVLKRRWNIYEDRPVKDAAELFRVLRRLVISDSSRFEQLMEILGWHDRVIVFYNYDYELEILRKLNDGVVVAEWNGHNHQPLPTSSKWVYLVQYQSGAEGWNCIETNAMVLYSLTYSYKNYVQAMGRIDRLDTPYTDLFYYIMMTKSAPDLAVRRSLYLKKDFNELRAKV